MQTRIKSKYLDTDQGQEADRILRSCVHCGFCTATCPTYQLLGDELDGPRGRIYLIKQFLEGEKASTRTQLHLDRCLLCRSCETTCPSGVQYGRLLDIGRELVEEAVNRSWITTLQRLLLRKLLPYPGRIQPLFKLSQHLRPLLPHSLKRRIPARQAKLLRPAAPHQRRMLILEGCVQSIATPATNAASARVLDSLGIQLISATTAGCCGAVSYHLGALEEGRAFMRRNIDAWWPHVEAGAEAILITASGCGVQIKEYGYLLKDDPVYAQKAARISALARDISEVLHEETPPSDALQPGVTRVAFHSPCTLQHGQKLNTVVESILEKWGFTLTTVPDKHLCCGSAGTYSIMQPALSQQLLGNKIKALQSDTPEIIATANIGCQLHLASKAQRPVRHWIELLDDTLVS